MESAAPIDVVRQFLKDWENGFVGAFEKWMSDDALWQNTGFPDAKGRDAYMDLLRRYQSVTAMPYGRAEIINIASAGDVVLTERVDHLWGDGEHKHSAKIMGAFVVRDGRIVRYSDHFDASKFNPEKFAGLLGA